MAAKPPSVHSGPATGIPSPNSPITAADLMNKKAELKQINNSSTPAPTPSPRAETDQPPPEKKNKEDVLSTTPTPTPKNKTPDTAKDKNNGGINEIERLSREIVESRTKDVKKNFGKVMDNINQLGEKFQKSLKSISSTPNAAQPNKDQTAEGPAGTKPKLPTSDAGGTPPVPPAP